MAENGPNLGKNAIFLATTRLLGDHPTTFVLPARGLIEFWKNTTKFEKSSNGAATNWSRSYHRTGGKGGRKVATC